ncbi:MAG: transglutaminase-like domain-containing protein [bacterium]|nr:transglutaminase-like domain-containing protein [bacterium]
MGILISIFLLIQASVRADTTWIGMYLMGNKVGYSSVVVEPRNDGYKVKETNLMQVQMLGMSKKVLINSELNTDRNFKLLSAKFNMVTQDQKLTGKISVNKDTLFLNYQAESSSPVTKKVNVTAPLYVETTLRLYLEKSRAKRMYVVLLDIPTATISDAVCELVKEEGNTLTYSLTYQGTESKIIIRKGKFVKEEGPMGIVLQVEDRNRAMEIAKEIDVTELYAIKPNVPIRAYKYLRLKLVGPVGNISPALGPQRVLEKKANFLRLEILKPEIDCTNEKVLGDLTPYLKPDPYIQSDDPEVVALANQITAGIKNPCRKVEAIINWLQSSISKVPSVTIPTATDVLRERRGDCNEHAVLFAALARASGIPADIVVGLIYQDEAYYYHAWNMVYLGGKWIFVDPIFAEFPASLSHLALARGSLEKQTEIMQIVGEIKIVVEDQK